MANITSTKTLGIIPCTKAKIWDEYPNIGSVLAKNAYTNPFHGLARTYVTLFTPNWVILSAKYGFLDPNDLIEGFYDVTFDRPNDPFISILELQQQIKMQQLSAYEKLIIVSNNRYVNIIRQSFDNQKLLINAPFENIEDDEMGSFILNQCILDITRKPIC